jgi:hypothetical protein
MLTSRLTLGPWIMPMVEAAVRAAVIGLVKTGSLAQIPVRRWG